MASTFWMGITAIVVVAIISDTIVKIIKAAKSGGDKYAERVQDLGGDPLLFAEQPQQQVLRSDVRVIELAGFGHRELEYLLGA